MNALALALVLAALPARPALPPAIRAFLAHPQATFHRQRVPRGFRMIVLSNLAQGCAETKNAGCLDRLVAIALSPGVRPWKGAAPVKLGRDNLLYTHLLFVLAEHERVAKDRLHAALIDRLANHLATAILRDPRRNAPSYASSSQRWPADVSAMLAALALVDRIRGTHLHDAPAREWFDWLDHHATDRATGLPYSEVTGSTATSRLPRGCALSWSVRYLASFDLPAARDLWRRYRARYRVDFGPFAGLREWPPGVDRRGDADSGPILMGVGSAATAFGIGAARAVGDLTTAGELARTEDGGAGLAHLARGSLARAADGIVAQSVLFAVEHTPVPR